MKKIYLIVALLCVEQSMLEICYFNRDTSILEVVWGFLIFGVSLWFLTNEAITSIGRYTDRKFDEAMKLQAKQRTEHPL